MFFECLTQFKKIINIIIFIEILAISHVLDEIETFDLEFFETLYIFTSVLTATSLKRENFIQNLWYDIKSHSERHLRTSYELVFLCNNLEYKIFETFSLRATYIPCFVPLDIGVVMSHILELPTNEQRKWRRDPCVFWDQVFNLNQRAFMQNNQILQGGFGRTAFHYILRDQLQEKRRVVVHGNENEELLLRKSMTLHFVT